MTELAAAGFVEGLEVGNADGGLDRGDGLGAWISRHSESVYGTVAGLPPGHHYGPSTLSADRRTLFLVCFDAPRDAVSLRGVRNRINRAAILGTGQALDHRVVGGFGEACSNGRCPPCDPMS